MKPECQRCFSFECRCVTLLIESCAPGARGAVLGLTKGLQDHHLIRSGKDDTVFCATVYQIRGQKVCALSANPEQKARQKAKHLQCI